MPRLLALSLIIVAFIVGIGTGFAISPAYSQMGKDDNHTTDLGIADRKYDLRFIDAMIAHHLGAIEMAQEAKQNSNRSEISSLSNNIINAQEKEIEEMYKWKKEWYNDTREVGLNDFSMNVNLGTYDEKYDLRFLNAMIAHHKIAVEMAQDAQTKSSRNEILNIAYSIISDQNSEIEKMNEWRAEWYKIND